MKLFKFLSICILTVNIYATSIEITSPTEPITFKDGDEYFTDVQNNAIDFDKRRDILWEEKFDESSISTVNNIWQGSYVPGGYIMPLFQGMDGAIQNGLIGNNYPLDSSKYSVVSILGKVVKRYVEDKNSWFQLFWTQDSSYHNSTWSKISGIDGYQLRKTGEVLMHSDNKYVHYLHDLSENKEWTGSDIRAIKHSLSNQATPSVGYKHIRIFDPKTSPMLTVTWTADNLPFGAATEPQVEIYIDNDNSNYNGNLFFRFNGGTSFFRDIPATTNSFTFPTAALSPGEYYIYLKLYSDYDTDDSDTDTLLATSGYSAKITINAKSVIEFKNPSMTSGEDYATAVLDNPWDMNDSSDIPAEYYLSNSIFDTSIYRATTDRSDSYLFLHVDNYYKPIDTSKYRYVSFTAEINDSKVSKKHFNGNIQEKVADGWMSRFFWGGEDWIDPDSVTNDIMLYEGLKTYSIDLLSDVADDTMENPVFWNTYPEVTYFRFDPLEVSDTEFYIHNFKLTANPEPDSNGKFTIKFTLKDKENDTINIKFYIDNNKSGFNGEYVGSENYTSGENTYTFDTCHMNKGEYFIYSVATDSMGNISKHYAEVPILIKKSYMLPSVIMYLSN